MKKFFILILYFLCLAINSGAQKGLNVSTLFSGEYNKNSNAVVVIMKGRELESYKLSFFHSISVKNSEYDVAKFEKAVLADGKNAVNSKVIKNGNKVLAAYYQLPPALNSDKDANRFILFHKENSGNATIIYLEGKTDLDALIKIFINKKK